LSVIPSWAVPGARVVCVDAKWSSEPPADPLRLGLVYTIESAYIWDAMIGAQVVVRLVEIDHPFLPGFGYLLDRFRPVVTRSLEQDVAEFRKLLDHIPEAVA